MSIRSLCNGSKQQVHAIHPPQCRKRIQQRGVHQSTVDLAISYGIKKGDKFILGKKQLKVVLSELDEIRKKVIKAVDQGGIIAVKNDGCLITTYRVNSFNQKLSRS